VHFTRNAVHPRTILVFQQVDFSIQIKYRIIGEGVGGVQNIKKYFFEQLLRFFIADFLGKEVL